MKSGAYRFAPLVNIVRANSRTPTLGHKLSWRSNVPGGPMAVCGACTPGRSGSRSRNTRPTESVKRTPLSRTNAQFLASDDGRCALRQACRSAPAFTQPPHPGRLCGTADHARKVAHSRSSRICARQVRQRPFQVEQPPMRKIGPLTWPRGPALAMSVVAFDNVCIRCILPD